MLSKPQASPQTIFRCTNRNATARLRSGTPLAGERPDRFTDAKIVPNRTASYRNGPHMLFEKKFIRTEPLASGVAPGQRALSGRWTATMPSRSTAMVRCVFFCAAAFADAFAIVASALAGGIAYHLAFYADRGPFDAHFGMGCAIAALFVLPNVMRDEYAMSRYFSYDGHLHRSFVLWNIAFLSALLLAFLTKTTTEVSRGAVILFYVAGLVSVGGIRSILVATVQLRARIGTLSARRVFLVGYEEDMRRFSEQYRPWTLGMRIVAASVLRGESSLDEDLALASASARILRPDDVYILLPWSQKETIDSCVSAFLRVPAAIHLGPERVLDRFADAQIERNGPISSLNLARRPLSTSEYVEKRLLDIFISFVALVGLAPLFLILSIMIKLDSPGLAIFRQRRYGFNQEAFRIYKFRSMTSLDDGRVVEQARANDSRVTRMGRFMRRWNIDELPQLLNVLRGEMSLVGPRPHAMAHDQHFERVIALYARRHNVKPGITGWAQVNGLRGETDTTQKMRDRVEHDLYYIDNWSIWLDLRILVMTIFSRNAYRNAR